MDIFAFAMKMEQDGETFYRELAQKTTHKGVANILEMLADEEVKHYKAIKAMQGGANTMAETDVVGRARNIFQRIREFGDALDTCSDDITMYRQAMKLEKQSEDFYLDRADQVDEQGQKQLFLQLAGEEKKHYYLLENIVDFVSRPQHWLENAEFFHMEDY
ncbi:MAG: ferritin family protein [Anaerohalosphaeraceae bacterium]